MKGSDLRSHFWTGLSVRIAERSDWRLGTFKHQHGSDAYIEFQERLGLGFRPRAVFLTNDNQLRAEILTTGNKGGLELLNSLLASGRLLKTANAGFAEVSVSHGRSDGKVQVVWENAMTLNRKLWSVHYDWIGQTLCDLKETLAPLITEADQTP